MIIDLLKNAELYQNQDERLRKAFDYLASQDFSKLENGRYDIDGDNIYAMVQRYDTNPRENNTWEAHHRYIDVQYVASGIETMGCSHVDSLKVTEPYSKENDYFLLAGSGDYFTVRAGMFAVFFPEDAHSPCLAYDNPTPVVKVVVKVLVTDDIK